MTTDFEWVFEEILFEAEMNRKECSDPDAVKLASERCGEKPENRSERIEELWTMIIERKECSPPSMDDAFLLKFLRARKSIPARAHRLLVRYCKFRKENPQFWRDVGWSCLKNIGEIIYSPSYDRPDVGRLIVSKLGSWDPDIIPMEKVLQSTLLMLEIGILQPKLQILGGTLLVDCDGLSMRHLKCFSPSVVAQIASILGHSFPLQFLAMHVINVSRFMETLFPLFTKFVPASDFWKNVYFHGYDIKSLHKYIDPQCLPKKYGGVHEEFSMTYWFNMTKKYKDEEFECIMKSLGYVVDI